MTRFILRWILYQEKNYKGQIFVIKDGEKYGYDKFKGYFNDKALSLRLLDENVSIELVYTNLTEFEMFSMSLALTFEME